ncbi:MAG: histidine kinase [Microbacterium sp.]
MTQSTGLVPSFAALMVGRAAAAAGLVAAIAAVATAAALIEAETTRAAGGSAVVLMTVVGVVVVAIDAWVLSARQPSAAVGASVVALATTAGMAAHVVALPDRAQALLLSVGPLAVAGAAAVGSGWRQGGGPSAWVLWGLPSVAASVLVLGFDPLREPSCAGGCADAPAALAAVVSTRAALWIAVVLMFAALCVYTATVVRGGRRTAPMVVLLAGGACMAAVTAAGCIRAAAWQSGSAVSHLIAPLGVLALAVGASIALAAAARTRAAAGRLMASLSSHGTNALVGAQFAVPGEDRWVDGEGGRAATGTDFVVIDSAEGPIARVPRSAAPEWAVGTEQIGPAALLALRNAQLGAVARSRVEELRASRRQIVEAADAEGRQLERDLHDGAQQRLVSAALHLAVVRQADTDGEELAAADRDIREALGRLREIAHGITPGVLRAEGVWAAIADLADNADATLVRPLPDTRPQDLAAETALFRGVALTIDLASGTPSARTRVEGWAQDGSIGAQVEVTAGAVDTNSLVDASDRIGALGGTLSITPSEDGYRVRMEVPCGS